MKELKEKHEQEGTDAFGFPKSNIDQTVKPKGLPPTAKELWQRKKRNV